MKFIDKRITREENRMSNNIALITRRMDEDGKQFIDLEIKIEGEKDFFQTYEDTTGRLSLQLIKLIKNDLAEFFTNINETEEQDGRN